MGVIWRTAMSLLSTLAALIIIVHSAEDDLDANYRYDLRSRVLDTGTPSYDQPWRAVQSESMLHQSKPTNWDMASSDESHRRRRPGRKRKRRPIELATEEAILENKYVYTNEPSPSFHEPKYINSYEVTDAPRRRRKKINTRSNRWTDESVDTEKPVRRRGYRRKRPTLETWPQLSEFSGHRTDSSSIESKKLDGSDLQMESNVYSKEDRGSLPFVESRIENDESRNLKISDVMPASEDHEVLELDTKDNVQKPQMLEDKSLSEFSSEIFSEPKTKVEDEVVSRQKKIKEKTPNIKNDLEKLQDSGPIDPLTLKEILKRSNGTSLSEILQQHNLSLADLLHGKENVLSILKKDASSLEQENSRPVLDLEADVPLITKDETEENFKTLPPIHDRTENATVNRNVSTMNLIQNLNNTNKEIDLKPIHPKQGININENIKIRQNRTRFMNRRRYPLGIRKKLRMRPMVNSTFKNQLSRDMMALNVKRYYNRRNDTKSQQWKEIVPLIKNVSIDNEIDDNTEAIETTTVFITTEDTTTVLDSETYPSSVTEDINMNVNESKNAIEISNIDMTESTTTEIGTTESVTDYIITDKPITTPTVQLLNASTIRRQAHNNRLKNKRLKQKISTVTTPRDSIVKSNISTVDTFISSEFIAKARPDLNTIDERQNFEVLEDFLTTSSSKNVENNAILKETFSSRPSISRVSLSSTTEETAKFEIEEILNDTRTSARLSKILMERNMTLSELVEHRERGSSHVHLADIFHNASREPNPPEPFLSKSLIEPISKETYPLRALLDANLHDPVTKVTTTVPLQLQEKYMNIPVVMNFGNNVNENAENMGIMSLFNNFTSNDTNTVSKVLQKDSQGALYESSVTTINSTNINNGVREGRLLNDSQDLMNWKEIFSMIRKIGSNKTEKNLDTYTKELLPSETYKKITLKEDIDGDGLIVLEDLQHLRDFDSHIAPDSNENLQVNSYEETDVSTKPGILDKIPYNTKSVTVAIASIVGLATILFLLTYATFKWRQQRKRHKRRSFCDERIPTPVFENRKGNKNNSSTRSISPMLSSSNIYTMNTVDSHHGKDSPEYMWDTLRKPFQ